MDYRYDTVFAQNPEFLLALQLSAPHSEGGPPLPSVFIDFAEDTATVTTTLTRSNPSAIRLFASKDTIFQSRGEAFASELMRQVDTFVFNNVKENQTYAPSFEILKSGSERLTSNTASFLAQLNPSSDETGTAWSKTEKALAFLEEERLAIDPVLTSTFMVLSGLVPVRFSVRTPKGERVHKEYRVSAGYWSLDVTRGVNKGKPFTDIDFKFRGLNLVRKVIASLAKEFVTAEDLQRTMDGKARLPRSPTPDLDV